MKSKRRNLNWWSISSVTARKLRKKGVMVRWSSQFESMVRWNPLIKEQVNEQF